MLSSLSASREARRGATD